MKFSNWKYDAQSLYMSVVWKLIIILIVYLAFTTISFQGYIFEANFVYKSLTNHPVFLLGFATWDAQHYLCLAKLVYTEMHESNLMSMACGIEFNLAEVCER